MICVRGPQRRHDLDLFGDKNGKRFLFFPLTDYTLQMRATFFFFFVLWSPTTRFGQIGTPYETCTVRARDSEQFAEYVIGVDFVRFATL